MAIIGDNREPGLEGPGSEGRASSREDAARGLRPAGDHLNRFLLCALVRESARAIKASADKAGEHLPMSLLTRSVLRKYRAVAKDKHGPLAGPQPDLPGLVRLNRAILRAEIATMSRDRVKISEARLAEAKRAGDSTRISVEKEQLEQALETVSRMARKFDFNR